MEQSNTYRVYVLNTQNPLAPLVVVAYIGAAKYGEAWKAARARLAGENERADKHGTVLFSDQERKTVSDIGFGDHLVVAKVDDMKPRNVKLDKTALQAIVNDPTVSDTAKLQALQQLLGTGPAAASPAPTPAPAGKGGGKQAAAA